MCRKIAVICAFLSFHFFFGEITLLLIMSWWILWMMKPYIRHQQSSKFMHTHKNFKRENIVRDKKQSNYKIFIQLEKFNLKLRPNSIITYYVCSLFDLNSKKFLQKFKRWKFSNEVIIWSLKKVESFLQRNYTRKAINDLFMYFPPRFLHSYTCQVPVLNRHIRLSIPKQKLRGKTRFKHIFFDKWEELKMRVSNFGISQNMCTQTIIHSCDKRPQIIRLSTRESLV